MLMKLYKAWKVNQIEEKKTFFLSQAFMRSEKKCSERQPYKINLVLKKTKLKFISFLTSI